MKLLLLALLLISKLSYASLTAEEMIKYCYSSTTISSAINNCLYNNYNKIRKELHSTFNELNQRIESQQKYVTHYSILRKKITASQKNWQNSVSADCLMEAYVYEKESYAFFSTNYSCLIDRYAQRIDYYRNFKFM